eukprot:CAMPEP_0172303460 /NCGR_PEP_ID=MMETSP1058-20130122/4994_1 /TAXON_ID=83371 /ORGANISM="Detonula confervacea, Strain CCMP 353" /LENGTH=173 /DNA_ID=CAMNT_0013014281 /DNA_START=96 /DNA_END=617 /DNA_ORIENTATION=-
MATLRSVTVSSLIAFFLLASSCHAFTNSNVAQSPLVQPSTSAVVMHDHASDNDTTSSRRSFMTNISATAATLFSSAIVFGSSEANAATDCMSDCLQSCKLIAPKDPQYCQSNCQSYCDQPDRTDGLSGSVSSTGGEVGILGFNTVVKGEDKPPSVKVPGLDFTSGGGKKLLGY